MIRHIENGALRPGLRLLRYLESRWRRWANRGDLHRARELVPAILSTLPPQPDAPPPADWHVHRVHWTDTDVVVITVGPAGHLPLAVLKLPQSDYGAVTLRRQEMVLAALHADPRLGEWCALVARPLLEGKIAGQIYVAEQALPGREAGTLLPDMAAYARACRAAALAIGQLHRRTASSIVVDEALLVRWVDEPLLQIKWAIAKLPRPAPYCVAVERLAANLREELAGRTLWVGWIHGDFWPGNMLVTNDGRALTGIVDWAVAVPAELPMHDMLHLLVSTRVLVQKRDVGEIVGALLAGAGWMPHERALLDMVEPAPPGETVGERVMLLLFWLRYMAFHIVQHPNLVRHGRWVRRNIGSVLEAIPVS